MHLPSRGRLLVLPTLNEEIGLELTLRELSSVPFSPPELRPTVLVMDGGSTDRTEEVARAWGVLFRRQQTRGKGSAVREALEWAEKRGYAAVAVMDADATYPCSSLPALFDLLETRHDVVIGVRRPERKPLATLRDLVHRIGNGALIYAAAQLSGKPLLDICSGFWGLRPNVLTTLDLRSEGFEIESELFLKSFRRGLAVAQIPVAYRTRAGTAKLHAVRDGARILLSIFRHALPRPGSPTASSAHRSRPVDTDAPTLLLGLGAERVVVLSAPERLVEADRMARRLSAAVPGAEVTTATLPPNAPTAAEGPLLTGLVAPSLHPSLPTVVTLLPRLPGPPAEAPVFVGIPRTQRLVRLGRSSVARAPAASVVGLGFRPERAPAGRLGAWYILAATLEPSGAHKELAMLRANAAPAALEVYRRAALPTGARGWWERLASPRPARFVLRDVRSR